MIIAHSGKQHMRKASTICNFSNLMKNYGFFQRKKKMKVFSKHTKDAPIVTLTYTPLTYANFIVP